MLKSVLFALDVLEDKFDVNKTVSCNKGSIPPWMLVSWNRNMRFDYPRLTRVDDNRNLRVLVQLM